MGISLTGTMKGADLLIGYVDYMGKPHVLVSTQYATPAPTPIKRTRN
ncbi:hypothetical protein E2C01_072077 [Portunus trituberculatus]|uniref:Uncharacterized protein n=1 Tax=Portunus trituberculatus TaxID=210409 RepID=A0A5B7I6V2_PORTR|nr:hypothetical protein [Portunus trituberculatus]